MTKELFLKTAEENLAQCMAIMKKKNADYGGDVDPFNNFKNSEIVGVNLQDGILVRIMDKISRISILMKREGRVGQVADEKIEDTILDGINYLNILLLSLQAEDMEHDA